MFTYLNKNLNKILCQYVIYFPLVFFLTWYSKFKIYKNGKW